MTSWRIPTPKARRAATLGAAPFLAATCPVCGHATDDEMLVELVGLAAPARTALGLPGADVMCTNVCLDRWLNAGGELVALYRVLGADQAAIAAATLFDAAHPGRFARLARQAPRL